MTALTNKSGEDKMKSEIWIESDAVSFTYQGSKTQALTDISLSIKKGECVVLCGKSGCGKTSFSRLLNGLVPEFYTGELNGSCRVNDLFAGKAAIEKYVPLVGSVFQNPKTQYFNVDTTAELAFPCENSGMPSDKIRSRVDEVVSEFSISSLMDRSVFKLSGGEKQQIAFAAACMLKPGLLVLDEPTSNLDFAAIERLHDMIAKMKQSGTTIVIAEHRLAWITDLADRYIFFEDGRLSKKWTKDEFLNLTDESLVKNGLRARNLDICREKWHKKTNQFCEGTPLIKLDRVTIGYQKKPIFTLPDFDLKKGEIVGVMGHNGIGKSTLARTLCGLMEPVEGRIIWNDQPASARMRLKNSFLVMQDVNYQLFGDSVKEEILLGAAYPKHCDEVMEALGLEAFADRHPMSLSGGQKQRVVIAAAMLTDKQLLILDEPTSGLDRSHMEQVGMLLQQLKAQKKTIVVITHDDELAADWCDRVVFLQDYR